MSDELSKTVPTEGPLAETHGRQAQKIAAVILGGYAFYVGLFAGQMLCPLLGAGGG